MTKSINIHSLNTNLLAVATCGKISAVASTPSYDRKSYGNFSQLMNQEHFIK